jgi:hypothetical protein
MWEFLGEIGGEDFITARGFTSDRIYVLVVVVVVVVVHQGSWWSKSVQGLWEQHMSAVIARVGNLIRTRTLQSVGPGFGTCRLHSARIAKVVESSSSSIIVHDLSS